MPSNNDQDRNDLLLRLQSLLYEYHELGHFAEARPHILWLMEIAEKPARRPEQRSAA